MIKKILYIPLILIVLFGCSSDNDNINTEEDEEIIVDEEPSELSIYKFTRNFYYNGLPDYSLEIVYNIDGRITGINGGFNYSIYNYNTENRLNKIQFYNNEDELIGEYKYEYDSNNVLIKFIDNSSFEDQTLTTLFTYEGNEIDLYQEESGKEGKLIFDSNNKLIENSWTSSPNTIYKEVITYNSDEQISEIKVYSNNSYQYSNTFEFDTKINPLYKDFILSPLNYFTYGLFNTEYDGSSYFFSKFNVLKKIRNNDIYDKTIQYNNNNYPISSTLLKNGVLNEEQSFEYY